MEHSVQTYIDRLTTEQLERFIEQYYTGELTEDFSNMVPYLHYVLERRKAGLQQNTLSDI